MLCFCMQHPAYEMRISDWSSDVVSSVLIGRQQDVLDLRAGDEGIGCVGLALRARHAGQEQTFAPGHQLLAETQVDAALVTEPPGAIDIGLKKTRALAVAEARLAAALAVVRVRRRQATGTGLVDRFGRAVGVLRVTAILEERRD